MIRDSKNPHKIAKGEGVRCKCLEVWVNEDELAHIQSKAAIAGLSRSRYCREVLMGHKVKARDVSLTPELIRINSALGHIGNNVNQAVRFMHQNGANPKMVEYLKLQLNNLNIMIEGISEHILK